MARRNNDERQGAAPQDDAPPASAVAQPTTGLNFVVPTEVVDLPSRGAGQSITRKLHAQPVLL